jgi:glycosyltransferase involved in cell wall biosynthesis
MKSSKVVFTDANLKTQFNMSYKPLVSFIIPVLNSERTLEKCLRSIVMQDYPYIEIVIVGNGSTDRSMEIAKRFTTKIYSLKGPLGDVRRLGLENSSGELIALWDSDIYIFPTKWLSESVKTFMGFPKASTLWVRTTAPPDATMVAKAYDWYSWSVMLDFARRGIGFWGGGASIFRRKAITHVGGITKGVDTGEDYDIAKKLAEKGYEVIFYGNPVYHDSHRTLTELIQKDIRRAQNFKKMGLARSIGIPLNELVKTEIKVMLLSVKGSFNRRKAYLWIVPIIIILRLLIYSIMYLVP